MEHDRTRPLPLEATWCSTRSNDRSRVQVRGAARRREAVEKRASKPTDERCADCGADLGHRHRSTQRCASCAERRRKAMARKREGRERVDQTARLCSDCGAEFYHNQPVTKRCADCRRRRKTTNQPFGLGDAAARSTTTSLVPVSYAEIVESLQIAERRRSLTWEKRYGPFIDECLRFIEKLRERGQLPEPQSTEGAGDDR